MSKSIAKTIVTVFVFACAVGFNSSMFSVVISTSGSTRPAFTMESRNPSVSKQEKIEIRSFAVYDKKDGKWDYGNAVWEIKTAREFSIPIKTITYGTVPDGFIETFRAQELVPGAEYQGVGFGPNATGSADFKR